MLHYMYNKNLGSGELKNRLLVDRALEVLREWSKASRKVYGNPTVFSSTYYLKLKTYGLVWHDRIITQRKKSYDKV